MQPEKNRGEYLRVPGEPIADFFANLFAKLFANQALNNCEPAAPLF